MMCLYRDLWLRGVSRKIERTASIHLLYCSRSALFLYQRWHASWSGAIGLRVSSMSNTGWPRSLRVRNL